MTETIVLLDPNNILIDPDRYRKDLGDIATLTDSIKTLGKNIIPIIVIPSDTDGKFTLVAGERRTTACKAAGVNVRAIVTTLDDVEHRIWEITENLERKDFDWREKVSATTDLMDMLRAKYKKMPLREAAKKTGLSVGAISTDLGLAEVLKADPELFARCKTRDSALKVLQKYKLDETHAELALRKKKTNYGAKAQNFLFHGSCLDLIDNLPDKIVNVLITDPPYGLDLKNIKRRDSADVAGKASTYEDDADDYYVMIAELLGKLNRVMAETSAFCFFCKVENFTWVVEEFTRLGYNVDTMPGIWYRTGSAGQTNSPNSYFARSYEVFVYGTRGDYSLVKRGQSNILPFAGVSTSDKIHVVEKPLGLMEELVSRFCLPGQVVLDPFSGSATTIVAALKAGCKAIGFEKDEINYNRALLRIADFLSAKDAGKLNEVEG